MDDPMAIPSVVLLDALNIEDKSSPGTPHSTFPWQLFSCGSIPTDLCVKSHDGVWPAASVNVAFPLAGLLFFSFSVLAFKRASDVAMPMRCRYRGQLWRAKGQATAKRVAGLGKASAYARR
jgi:hypothetical protein